MFGLVEVRQPVEWVWSEIPDCVWWQTFHMFSVIHLK